jgi:hypothetical protein
MSHISPTSSSIFSQQAIFQLILATMRETILLVVVLRMHIIIVRVEHIVLHSHAKPPTLSALQAIVLLVVIVTELELVFLKHALQDTAVLAVVTAMLVEVVQPSWRIQTPAVGMQHALPEIVQTGGHQSAARPTTGAVQQIQTAWQTQAAIQQHQTASTLLRNGQSILQV